MTLSQRNVSQRNASLRSDEERRYGRVQSRRRIVTRIGLLAIVVASLTACIFDQSDYKGGGRLDKGATAKTSEPPPPQPTDTTDTTSSSGSSGGTPSDSGAQAD